jgi:hypothetical protein
VSAPGFPRHVISETGCESNKSANRTEKNIRFVFIIMSFLRLVVSQTNWPIELKNHKICFHNNIISETGCESNKSANRTEKNITFVFIIMSLLRLVASQTNWPIELKKHKICFHNNIISETGCESNKLANRTEKP